MLKKSLKTRKKYLYLTACITIIISLFLCTTVFAAGPVAPTSADALAGSIYTKISPILKAFGGLTALVGVAIIGFKLMFAQKNPEKRSELMSGIMYIGIGCFLVGGAAMFAGFLWGLGA